MGNLWTGHSKDSLDKVQDDVLGLATGHWAAKGMPVRFRRFQTEIWHVDPVGGKESEEQVHCIECVPERGHAREEPPIVIVHGYAAGALLFTKNLATVANRTKRRVLAVDWLGCAGSSRPKYTARDENESIDFFLGAFEKWRSEQKIESFDLVGHSLGGYLSTWYTLRYPQRVRKLVLASPVGLPDAPDMSKADLPATFRIAGHLWGLGLNPNHFIRFCGPLGYRLVNRIAKGRFEGDTTLGVGGLEKEKHSDLIPKYMHQISAGPGSGEHALGSILLPFAFAKKPIHKELAKLKGRDVLVIFGDRDWMRRDIHAAHRAASEMDRCQVVTIPGSHHVYLDEQFDDRIVQFLANVTPSQVQVEVM